ncbi:MAG: peptide ABC transporter substrate-binding protein [Nitrospirae bacterium CG08_land_8_20_14_0_20_52_24]|nr:MAG: peptide ABC transporter substrate-binding protein [Nitrospirae bacterium CG08_land_8_20_14_0_20_52_24]
MKFTAFLTMMLTLLISACNSGGIPPDTVVIGIESEPTNLDPRLATDANSSRINGLIYSGLLRQDENGLIQPDLAVNWETPDPGTYLFHLREGVRFHDGTVLTSRDVKYTFESILDPALGSPHKSTFEQIERIETPDDKTIRFVLREPFAPFLLSMTMGIVLAQSASAQGADFAKAPVGTGPFRLAKRNTGESYDLWANPDYFEGAPKLSRVIFRVVPDNTVRFLELQKGTLNLVVNGIELDYIPLVNKDPRLKLMTGPGVNYSYIGFNLTDPLLKKQKVREAIAHAVDRDSIIRHLLKEMAHPATGLLSPMNWAYYGEVKTFEYSPQKSRELLDQAGYPDPDGGGPGMRFTLSYKTSQDEQGKRIAAALQQQLKEVGIEVTIRSYEWGTFYGDIKSGNFQLYSLSWVGVTDPDIYDYIFHSKNFPPAGANRGRYANPEVNALLERARRTLDLSRRKAYYRKVQEILAADLPYVSLWHYDNVAVIRKNVEGFVLNPRGDLYSLKDVRVD